MGSLQLNDLFGGGSSGFVCPKCGTKHDAAWVKTETLRQLARIGGPSGMASTPPSLTCSVCGEVTRITL